MSVIGGADGPTTIYLANSPNWLLIFITAIMVVSIITFFLYKQRKK